MILIPRPWFQSAGFSILDRFIEMCELIKSRKINLVTTVSSGLRYWYCRYCMNNFMVISWPKVFVCWCLCRLLRYLKLCWQDFKWSDVRSKRGGNLWWWWWLKKKRASFLWRRNHTQTSSFFKKRTKPYFVGSNVVYMTFDMRLLSLRLNAATLYNTREALNHLKS